MADPPYTPDTARAARLADLTAFWLELRCPCRTTVYPVRMLAEGRAHRRLGDVAGRLRCTACCERPREVTLAESPYGESWRQTGRPRGWRVVLVGTEAG